MTDETQRTLITVAGTLSATVIGGFLTAGLQGWRERKKEDREAQASLCLERQKALLDVSKQMLRFVDASNRYKANLLRLELQKDIVQQCTKAYLGIQEVAPKAGVDVPDALKHGSDVLAESKRLYAEIKKDVLASIEAGSLAAIDATASAICYGRYPVASGLTNRLSYHLHMIIGSPIEETGQEGDAKRGLIVDIARDLGDLAAWEGERAATIRGRRKDPRQPAILDLRSLSERSSAVAIQARRDRGLPAQGD